MQHLRTGSTCPTVHMAGPKRERNRPIRIRGSRTSASRPMCAPCSRMAGRHGWSPELIAGRIELDQPGLSISHEAIYQYIYHPDTKDRQELIRCLRRAHRKRRNKGIGRKERKTKIPNRVPIDQRPQSVETRIRFGHWEGDRPGLQKESRSPQLPCGAQEPVSYADQARRQDSRGNL